MNNVKYDVNDMPKPGFLFFGLSFQHLLWDVWCDGACADFGWKLIPLLLFFSSGLQELWLHDGDQITKFSLWSSRNPPILRLCEHLMN